MSAGSRGCDESSGNGNGSGGSRWNPTKEQINMLESMYKQGLRTPTAQQIQHITARLREYGHIEGKNVFYWFQNHKARQRQKLKHHHDDKNLNHLSFFNHHHRFIHPTPPLFHNVVCYNNNNNNNNNMPRPPPPPMSIDPAGFYQQYPRVQVPPTGGGNFKRSRLVIPDQYQATESMLYPRRSQSSSSSSNHHQQQTLDLFPIHPTGGVLRAKNGIIGTENDEGIQSIKFNTSSPSEYDNDCSVFRNEKAGQGHPFFDFFCKN